MENSSNYKSGDIGMVQKERRQDRDIHGAVG